LTKLCTDQKKEVRKYIDISYKRKGSFLDAAGAFIWLFIEAANGVSGFQVPTEITAGEIANQQVIQGPFCQVVADVDFKGVTAKALNLDNTDGQVHIINKPQYTDIIEGWCNGNECFFRVKLGISFGQKLKVNSTTHVKADGCLLDATWDDLNFGIVLVEPTATVLVQIQGGMAWDSYGLPSGIKVSDFKILSGAVDWKNVEDLVCGNGESKTIKAVCSVIEKNIDDYIAEPVQRFVEGALTTNVFLGQEMDLNIQAAKDATAAP